MSAAARFDPSPPSPYSGDWEEAARPDKEGEPRFTTYQAPGGKPIPFIQESFDFSGGQSVDTAEYPFHGYWSNVALNEKTQRLTVEGFLRGAKYIAGRNALLQALRVKTDDDNPGYIDFPFWGRFPVVVLDYKIGEKTNEQGQCSVSLTFTRAGVTLADRLDAVPDVEGLFENAKETLRVSAIDDFLKKLKGGIDTAALAAGFLSLKRGLLDIVGRVQAGKTRLAVLTAEAIGFANLINQVIGGPKELAAAFLSSVEALVGGIKSIGEAARETHMDGNASGGGRGRAAYVGRGENNERNALMSFLSAADYAPAAAAATVTARDTLEAVGNLYRTAALMAAMELLLATPGLSYERTARYWNLLRALEESVDRNDPAVHSAVEDARVAVSIALSARGLSNEIKRVVSAQLPLLRLARYLGCDEARLRELNSIPDSFVIRGDIIYV
jgi:prophage DNA circulation protein